MLIDIALLCLGILLLFSGGELLIRGALSTARRLGVSALLTGLVIVGFGTSMPELVVSVDAALNERPDIAVGNVVGSNIGNILLILGLCALIHPLAVRPMALRRDAVVVLASSALFLLLAWGSALGRWDALVLLLGLAAYLGWAYWSERETSIPAATMHEAEAAELQVVPVRLGVAIASILGGLVLLIGGSRVLLIGAVSLAEDLGVSEAVIGLTLVAIGTSLPELSVSVIAAIRRHADVAVGNILGSNIFNMLGILGVSALLQPLPIHPRILAFDQWVLLVVSLVILAFLYTQRRLSRWEGALLLAGYLSYLYVGLVYFGT
ncbi:calcium/sodium antiporter [Alkalisalibacterium limincola]|uniref:Calcium/sodium antiporter n=1 Tax=Alkalisalibacterium limincola TaxID=2699169 RepID=A0A5C8KN70_9GAMM|nr:calcium/sodium antiporter [Alkalisalibacterium limincola]TXK62113.1 calcium/sodium antiporter [Alkalisalibacterium limincola]